MRISSINSFNFRANSKKNTPSRQNQESKYKYVDDGVMGYSDEISKGIRKFLRMYHDPHGDVDFYGDENYEGRIFDEFKLQKLMDEHSPHSKAKDFDKNAQDLVMELPLNNLGAFGNNRYYGQTLLNASDETFETLKKCGVERVITLSGSQKYQERVEKEGLEYYNLLIGGSSYDFWKETAFQSFDDYCDEKSYFGGYTDKDVLKNVYNQNTRVLIERLIGGVKVMNKGNFYIGCEYGRERTQDSLAVLCSINPKIHDFGIKKIDDEEKAEAIENLYKNLTEEDKERLGWDKEFEEEFRKNIKERKKLLTDGELYQTY